jgi:putative ABC transport system permease protein
MTSFGQDLRYALRMLLKSPGFAIVAILTLALGIGANVATFSVVYAVLLRPLPYPQPEQLVRVFDDLRSSNVKNVGMSAPELWDLQDRSGVFQELSAVWPIDSDIAGGDRPVRAETLAVSPGYFTMLGIKPQLGRVFTQQDSVPGFIEAVVISDGFWRRNYGADPKIIGRTMRLDNDLYQIIGVMPAGFRHPGRTLQTDVEVWCAAGYNAPPFPVPAVRAARFIPGAIGRLKPGLTVAQAQAQLDTFVAGLSRQYPNDYPAAASWATRIVPVKEDLVGPERTELFVLFGAVGFVLLIGCVNLANLLLARSSGRRREIAIRLALGAGRWRLMAQLLTESVLLSVISGLVALLTVVLFKNSILALAPASLPRLSEVHISAGVLFFAFVVSIATGLLFGLAPAVQAGNPNQVESLREGGRGSGAGRRHTQVSRVLVISEVALSLILLAGAGLLLRSFWHVLEVRPGFNPSHVVTAQIWIPVPNDPKTDPYRPIDKRAAFLMEILRRVSVLPGVEDAAIGGTNSLPLAAARNGFPFTIVGRPTDSERAPIAEFASVTPDYFGVLKVPLLAGRNFTESDADKSQQVVLIDQTLQRRYWANEDPLGKQISFGGRPGPNPSFTIVGVVGDMKSDGFDAPTAPHIYLPVRQNPGYASVVFLRSAGNPEALGESIRHEVQSIDPNIPVFNTRTMDQIISRSMAERRFALQLLGIFAGVALLLAAIGIYGVMAYSFSQRTHEIGVRIALGAQRVDIFRMAVGEGMQLVAIGLAIGLVGAAALTRSVRTMLFDVSPADPITFGAISATLAAVAFLACYVPARRATRVDPLVALRDE